jgi:hypothetical protein
MSRPQGLQSTPARRTADPLAGGRIRTAAASTAGETVVEPAVGIAGGGEVWRQTHGGVTPYALAAYAAFRARLLGSPLVVGSQEVLDHLGELVLVTTVKGDGLTLLLDGLTWGYRGTGPTGLAAVLVDLGAQPDLETAMRWVAALPIDGAWSIEVAP